MKKPVLACLIAGLVLIVVGPVSGVVGAVWSMVKAFNAAAAAQPGQASPAQLAAAIQRAMLSVVRGLPLSGFGLLLVVVALLVHAATRPTENEEEV